MGQPTLSLLPLNDKGRKTVTPGICAAPFSFSLACYRINNDLLLWEPQSPSSPEVIASGVMLNVQPYIKLMGQMTQSYHEHFQSQFGKWLQCVHTYGLTLRGLDVLIHIFFFLALVFEKGINLESDQFSACFTEVMFTGSQAFY